MKKLFNRFIIDFCAEGFMALRLVIGFFVLTFALSSYGQIIEPGNAPNKSQRKLMDRGYGMFIHFGVNTFSGHEWMVQHLWRNIIQLVLTVNSGCV